MSNVRDVARASLYNGTINLWVEDELTRAYLAEVWSDAAAKFLIGGGNEGVSAILNDAEAARYPNVFGVIDRDFRQSNKADWLGHQKTFRRFIIPAHEIENYLLDAPALSSSRLNNLRKSSQEIETMMQTAASGLCWWAACRIVVAQLRHRFHDDFLSDAPGSVVDSLDSALAHIRDSRWFLRVHHEITRSRESDIRKDLAAAHTDATQSLAQNRWKTEFAGKEVFRHIGSRICDRTQFTNYHPSSAEFDQDLAKDIGAWQRANNAVPSDLVDLLRALKMRIARQVGPP